MAWFQDWFDTPYYHILYSNRDYQEAEIFIRGLTDFLHLPQGSEIIDLACGKGRHSVFLNKLGYKVVGLDLSRESIAFDKQFENETLKFRVHDMREKIENPPVDAVFNLFTSFGYFDNAEDDSRVFRSVSDVLKPGGFFVLDFLNETFVKETLVPESETEKQGILFKINKKIENQYVIKDIRFSDKGEDFHYFEKVKLHTPHAIEELASQFGFERIRIFGNYNLENFHAESSPRCINIFRKK